MVNDGKIRLKVEECGKDFADCVVINGGQISNRKGVNVPDVELAVGRACRSKDRADLEFVVSLGVDWLAFSLSFSALLTLKKPAGWFKGRAAILSKIEKPNAVDRFEDDPSCQ